MLAFLSFLLPSFISNRYSKVPPRYVLKSTSWLDGLRGIACLFVYCYHFHGAWFPSLRDPWNSQTNNSFFLLPIIRIVHNGDTMVALFFVISGFALSVKSVKLMKEPVSIENSHSLLKDLASSAFRRYLRLALPCAGSFLLVGTFLWFGWYESIPYNGTHETWLQGGMVLTRPPRQDYLYDQVAWILNDYYKYAVHLILLNDYHDYRWETNGHLWTIPIEFRESLYVFLMILCLSHLKRWARVNLILPFCVGFGLYNGSWQFALFMLGFLLAEIHLKMESDRKYPDLGSPNSTYKTIYDRYPRLFQILKAAAFILALYIGSYPIRAPNEPETSGFTFLTAWTPQSITYKINDGPAYFWDALGAGMIVTSIVYLPDIQRLLCTDICQYLGRISFAFYLVHGPLLQSMAFTLLLSAWRAVGVAKLFNATIDDPTDAEANSIERWQLAATWFVFAINTVLTIWAADVFWRTFDAPSVRFCRWLEKKVVRD
ncbi:hypothetical protein TWF281_000662 [Arthrobotrys megalospora]